jgi:hypothetical protein
MRSQIGKTRALGCALIGAALSIAAITLTPIGPIFVYGWLVPIISPVIPKPDGVPSRATAQFNWKGAGLIWSWEDRVTGGCARWTAANVLGPIRWLDVFGGNQGCDAGVTMMSRSSRDDVTNYGSEPNEWPYKECPFTLSTATNRKYQKQVRDLLEVNSGEIEIEMLKAMLSELERLDGQGLRAQQYGCRIGKP